MNPKRKDLRFQMEWNANGFYSNLLVYDVEKIIVLGNCKVVFSVSGGGISVDGSDLRVRWFSGKTLEIRGRIREVKTCEKAD